MPMKASLQAKAAAYLREILGVEAIFTPFPGLGRLPLHITASYEIAQCALMDREFLALQGRDAGTTPAAMAKHADWLHQKTGLRCLFILDTVGAYERKRLIEDKIPFLAPGQQLYLPDLGLDLREQFRAAKRENLKISPAAQLVVLACLLRRMDPESEFTGAGLAERFGYTKMTMTRALDELRQLELVECEGERRFARHRFLITGRELWEKARPFLRSPVKKRVYVDEWFSGCDFKAGESALAELSMLVAPQRTIWAITSAEWKKIQREPGLHIIPDVSKDMAHAEFEIWHYDPRLFAEKPLVDRLSLALSLESIHDDRVQIAIDELLGGVPW
jgi:DNA-binding MarR family transcriptional regulator